MRQKPANGRKGNVFLANHKAGILWSWVMMSCWVIFHSGRLKIRLTCQLQLTEICFSNNEVSQGVILRSQGCHMVDEYYDFSGQMLLIVYLLSTLSLRSWMIWDWHRGAVRLALLALLRPRFTAFWDSQKLNFLRMMLHFFSSPELKFWSSIVVCCLMWGGGERNFDC